MESKSKLCARWLIPQQIARQLRPSPARRQDEGELCAKLFCAMERLSCQRSQEAV